MKIIVDTNIVFSAIISDKGKIGELLLNRPGELSFFSPTFLMDELDTHSEKILSVTGYSGSEYQQIKLLVTKNIKFVNAEEIATENWDTAYQLVKDVDLKDIAFLALSLQNESMLWTGDKKLIKGLQHKNYNKLITTDMLYSKYFQK